MGELLKISGAGLTGIDHYRGGPAKVSLDHLWFNSGSTVGNVMSTGVVSCLKRQHLASVDGIPYCRISRYSLH